MEKCKCERCGRIADVFQYTKFEVKEISYKTSHKDKRTGETIWTAHRKDIGEKRGLCEECAVEINKRNYDTKNAPMAPSDKEYLELFNPTHP